MIRCMDLRCMSSSPCGRCFAFVAGGASRRSRPRPARPGGRCFGARPGLELPQPSGASASCALTRYKFDVLRCTLYATVYAVCCIWLYKRVRYNHTAEPHCHATPVRSCTVYSSYSTYTVQPYSTCTVHHHTIQHPSGQTVPSHRPICLAARRSANPSCVSFFFRD